LDADLYEKWPNTKSSDWINIGEWKEKRRPEYPGDMNWRMAILVKRDVTKPNSRAYFELLREQTQPKRVVESATRNKNVDVPVGEWFKVEVFWKLDATDGRLFYSVNGETVFDFRGRTQHKTDPKTLNMVSYLKNYRNATWLAGDKSTYHMYDDFELWTDFPPARKSDSSVSLPTGEPDQPDEVVLEVVRSFSD